MKEWKNWRARGGGLGSEGTICTRHALGVRNCYFVWDGYTSGSSANKFEEEPEAWHWLLWTHSHPLPLLSFFNQSTQNPKSSQILFLAGQKNLLLTVSSFVRNKSPIFQTAVPQRSCSTHWAAFKTWTQCSQFSSSTSTQWNHIHPATDTSLASFQSDVWFPASPLRMFAARCFCLLTLS